MAAWYRKFFALAIACLIVSSLQPANAEGLWDNFSGLFSEKVAPGELTNNEIISGLKEALAKGTRSAVNNLGKKDGFFLNKRVKINLPKSLDKAGDALHLIGKDKYVDDFVLTMNRAAEEAVPQAASVFADSIKKMSISDAKQILDGPDDAATRYFQRTGEKKLQKKMLPIIKDATAKVGVTGQYKAMVGKLGPASSLVDSSALDLDGYITEKALDGLFLLVADEEKAIRQNPAARTTDILKKVFSH